MATVLQENASPIFGDGVTSVAIPFTSNVTAGSLVVICVGRYSDSPEDSFVVGDLTKTGGTATVTGIQLDQQGGDVNLHEAIYSFLVTGSGSLTMTLDTSGSTNQYSTISYTEFSGSWDSSRKEDSDVGSFSGTTLTTGSVTTAGGAVLVAVCSRIGGGTISITPGGSGWTQIVENEDDTTHQSFNSIRKITGSGSTETATWTFGSSTDGSGVIVAYKEAASASVYAFQGNAFQFGQYIGDGGPAGIDGELDQNIGNITLSATGQVVIRGTGTGNVIGAVTSSATGRVEIEGVGANNTIGAVTLSATGDVDIAGSADITIGAITSSATGTVLITGVGANNTIDNITVEATGVVGSILSGELDQNIGDITLSATGQVEIEGVASNNVGDITLSSTGIVEIHGSASATVGAVTASATGRVTVAGALSKSIGDITVSATGGVRNVGVLGSTIEPVTLSATGTVLLEGVLDKTIGNITVAATGVIGTLVTGQLNTSIGIFTVTATGNVSNTVRTMGASVQAGSLGGGLQKRAYSKSRFRQENMKWPSRG